MDGVVLLAVDLVLLQELPVGSFVLAKRAVVLASQLVLARMFVPLHVPCVVCLVLPRAALAFLVRTGPLLQQIRSVS